MTLSPLRAYPPFYPQLSALRLAPPAPPPRSKFIAVSANIGNIRENPGNGDTVNFVNFASGNATILEWSDWFGR